MQSLMTAFEGFSVSLDRTVFFSKHKCKLLSVAGLDINEKNDRISFASAFYWEFFVSFSSYY